MLEPNLHDYLARQSRSRPDAVCCEEESGAAITYGELARLAGATRDWLIAVGVQPGQRVGLCLDKSIDALGALFGILEAGAAYVPVAANSPPIRSAAILKDCEPAAIIASRRAVANLQPLLLQLGVRCPVLVAEEVGGGAGLRGALRRAAASSAAATPSPPCHVPSESPAYLLYTSGSTGKPKGVVISHRAALAFVEWGTSTFELDGTDRFSSHAPLHFDLSVWDIFVTTAIGACVVLISDALGRNARELAPFTARRRISVWYSTPSVLSLLTRSNLQSTPDPKLVLFAGEVFPVAQLRKLSEVWPRSRYFNLYGPTETNVCTFREIPAEIPPEREEPFPIGAVCSQLDGIIVDDNSKRLPPGSLGELCIAGPNVMTEYWRQPVLTRRAFLESAPGYYRTGDIVRELDGELVFVGRKDRMVKRRGFRVELGEIESCLHQHPRVREAAVVATQGSDGTVLLAARLSVEGDERLSAIELKRFCAERLPSYMVPDRFSFHDELPKTSTAKIDYQALQNLD